MSNFDLNHFLYNNILLEDENKELDKEIVDVFKDAVEDFADDLEDIKADVKEGVILTVAGISLALPEILKIIGKAAKKFSFFKTRKGYTGEKAIKLADGMHHTLTNIIKRALVLGLGAKEGPTLDKFINGIYHVLVASLMLTSGVGSLKAFKAKKIAFATLEAALTAVKSNEVGRFLQDLMGSGVMEEVSNKHNKENVMKDFNYTEYLRNNPLTEKLESDEDFGTGGEEVESLAADVVMGRISYKDAREKASKASFSMKELNNAISYVEDITGKRAPNYSIEDQVPIHRREEDEDYDADAEQDDENVGMGYDDEGRPLGEDKDPRQIEAEREMRDQAMVYYIGKLLDKEIDRLPDNPLQAYMDMLTQTAIDKDDEKLRRELGEGQRGDSKAGYSISDFTDRLDSIPMTTGGDHSIVRFKVDDEVIVKNSTELGVGTVTGVFPHKIDGKVADEMVYRVEFPNEEDTFYYDSELSLNPASTLKEESYSLKQFQRDLVTYIRTLAKEKGLKPDTAVRMAVVALQNADKLDEGKLSERLNVSRDALKRLYNEVGATTFSQMILELRDENALDDLVEALSYQYSGIMNEGLTIGGKKVKAIHTHDSNNVEDHTIEYEDGTEEPYLKHIQMKEARDYGMTYPSYKVEEFNTIGDMAHNGILNLMAFAEQHKPEVVGKIKAVAEEVMNLIYDDMEEFDTQPRIGVKEKKGKDHDGDGDIDSDDYKMAKDKAIKKAMKSETKSAPKGHYFTKSGNLVKGRLTKDARERGATQSDPKDKMRSKIPPVTQVREEDEPTAGQIKSSGGSLASIAGKLAKVAKDMKGLAKEYKVAKEAGDDKKVKDLLATLKVLTAHKKQLEKDLDNA